jgi:ATP-dependent RNA helicase MSS116, mitochondrial
MFEEYQHTAVVNDRIFTQLSRSLTSKGMEKRDLRNGARDGAAQEANGAKKRHRSVNSKKCYAFLKGNCQYGDECRFRHGNTEMPIKKQLSEESAPKTIQTTTISSFPPPPPARSIPPPQITQEPMKGEIENTGDTITSHLTNDTFNRLPISLHLIRAIEEKMGYSNLTEVQSKSLPDILSGKDCLARAKTGTGKTLAFLIPAIERIIRRDEEMKGRRPPPVKTISTLILSPTRELANQIGKEATTLLHFLPNHRVVTLTGGTNRNTDLRHMNDTITVLVATPGRLVDHLDNSEGIATRCQQICTLVLDEADVLLEMGFKPALDRIMGYLGLNPLRQTLLFSATLPPLVQQIASHVLKPGYAKIDTIGDDSTNHTHEHVEQDVIVTSMEDLIPTILLRLREELEIPNYKIIVFFTTARITGYMAALFRHLPEFANLLEIHSRKSQSYRTKSSEQFRQRNHSILFSSDVSARGMDYPNVTFVLQVGMTEKEQYIHRLGRTARAGKSGTGSLIIYNFEENFMLMKTLKSLSLVRRTVAPETLQRTSQEIQNLIQRTKTDHEMTQAGEQAYQAWLGFYNSNLRACNWDKGTLVQMANRFSEIIGFVEAPTLDPKTVGKMGLKGVAGLRIQRHIKEK